MRTAKIMITSIYSSGQFLKLLSHLISHEQLMMLYKY
jgi:hypothetical protein